MNVLLVAGSIHDIFYTKIPYKKNIINKKPLYTAQALELIEQGQVKVDQLLIIDEGIDEALESLINLRGVDSVIVTRNLCIVERYQVAHIIFVEEVRIAWKTYECIFKEQFLSKSPEIQQKKKEDSLALKVQHAEVMEQEVKAPVKEKLSLFSKFKRTKPKEEAVDEEEQFKTISHGISRVIAITGHRGVGITSTAVNLGYEAAKKGLKTIIVDLDHFNRTTNLYFGAFIRQVEEDEHMAASLIKCLAKPQDYLNSACQVKPNLWLTTLGYDFEDRRLMNQFYNAMKLMNLITVFKQSFNVILLDLPIEELGQYQEMIQVIDHFALCTQNSQYSVITTLRNMDHYLTNESIGYLNAKSKLVITRYNDRAHYENEFFTPDRVSELFASDLCDALSVQMPVAGAIRYDDQFDMQMEEDIPIAESNMAFKAYYDGILLRMLEGVN